MRDEVVVDGDLALALSQGKEVLFSSNDVVIIPIILEAQVLRKLGITAYSESVAVRRAAQSMQLDGDVRQSRARRYSTL